MSPGEIPTKQQRQKWLEQTRLPVPPSLQHVAPAARAHVRLPPQILKRATDHLESERIAQLSPKLRRSVSRAPALSFAAFGRLFSFLPNVGKIGLQYLVVVLHG